MKKQKSQNFVNLKTKKIQKKTKNYFKNPKNIKNKIN